MKYELDRLGPDGFEHLIQSLIRGIAGNSVMIYGDGPDGQREAVMENADLPVCENVVAYGRTVVQAKFKSPDTKTEDWDWLRNNLKAELDGFKKKTSTHPHMIPETYLFFTNLVLTPVLDRGLKDRAEKLAADYKSIIPNIRIFGVDDIRAMLDNNRDVARSYASFIMPGDVLVQLQENLREIHNEKFEDLIEYARQMFREDSAVRLEQAGSVSSRSINIRNVYTDLEAKVQNEPKSKIEQIAAHIIKLGNRVHRRESASVNAPAGNFPKRQRQAPECNIVLIGNAGQGKSTLCQYICQIYRAALLKRFRKGEPEIQYYFTDNPTSDISIPQCERFPVLISLKRYAAWINKQELENSRSVISYILSLINGRANAKLSIHDFRRLLSGYSWIFVFDGLDEVPASSNRNEVLKQIQDFLEKDLTESSCDSLVICTSRPQGYDDAFSTSRYNHYELKDMSKPLCEKYIEKLLTYLEDNSDERERYRRILHTALEDPMVSKLMTTPLYTAIIVLLVKMGGTPPTKRYSLFQEYCEIVVKREQQKETLPSLHDEYDWIARIHAQIGFLLQTESETAENAAAELSAVRCKQLITQFLQDEGFDGELSVKSDELYMAITNRLSFLSAISGPDQEDGVVFPLRSIQEYFAAEWLISFDDEDKLSEALEIISVSAYWRNVYLFVAGYFAKNRSRKNMNETLFRICQRNNGDKNHESPNAAAYRVAKQGSRLALDLLCDNLFSRPDDQRRYLNIASELLNWGSDFSNITGQFLQLPPKTAAIFLAEYVIPSVQDTKSADGIAFSVLWAMANSGDEAAYAKLEDLIGDVTVPDDSTIRRLLTIGFDKIGGNALQTLYQWITEDWFSEFCNPYISDDKYWSFMSFYYMRSQGAEISLPALRQAVYRMLLSSRFEYSRRRRKLIKKDLFMPHRLLQKMDTDNYLNELFSHRYFGAFELVYDTIGRYKAQLPLTKYVDEFKYFQLDELAALTEFLHSPTYSRLRELLEAYRNLPGNCKYGFTRLIRQFNWLLQEISNWLNTAENKEDDLYTHFNSEYFEACMKKDKELIQLAKKGDLVSITKSNSWGRINASYGETVSQDLIREVLANAEEKNINDDFISFLFVCTEAWNNISPELEQFGIRYYPFLFQTRYGAGLALEVFDRASPSFLASGKLEYPKSMYLTPVFYRIKENQAHRDLEMIDHLAEFGGDFLQAYALVPYLFHCTKNGLASKLGADTIVQHYHAVKAMGNQAACLGCILRLLSGPVSEEQKSAIWDELLETLHSDSFGYFWYLMAESLSAEGKMLIYEATTAVNGDDNQNNHDLLGKYADAILEELEAQSVERDELVRLSEAAHSDRQFL